MHVACNMLFVMHSYCVTEVVCLVMDMCDYHTVLCTIKTFYYTTHDLPNECNDINFISNMKGLGGLITA